MKKTLLFSVVIIFFGSCSIQKKLYSPGFNIEWKNNKITKSDAVVNEDEYTDSEMSEVDVENNINISNNRSENMSDQLEEEYSIAIEKDEIKSELNENLPIDCDIIICTNGDEIEAKVLEIGSNEIKYKN